jgi:hypothetical protein
MEKILLHIGLLIKQVPKVMKTGADGLMDRSGSSMINPYCNHALEEAIKLKETFLNSHYDKLFQKAQIIYIYCQIENWLVLILWQLLKLYQSL